MASKVAIIVTAEDAGATKVLDNVSASQRAAAKAAAEAGKATALAAKFAGDAVSEQSLRMVKAREAEKQAAADLARVQAAGNKGYLDEATNARTTAAALQRLTAAKMEMAAATARARMPQETQRANAALQQATRGGSTASKPSLKVAAATLEYDAAQKHLRETQERVAASTLSEEQKIKALASAMDHARHATVELKEAQAGVAKHGTGHVFSERVTEHLGEFGITESMAGTTAVVVGAVAVTTELGSKMREVVSEALEYGEAMHRASEKTGLSVETLSVMHTAAKITGGDFESMTAAVSKLDKALGAAAAGGNKKQAAAFESIGIDPRALSQQADGAEIALRRISQAMAATENPILRVKLATDLMGKAGAEQIPTLMALGSRWDEFRTVTERTGNMLTGETAEALAKTNQDLTKMGLAISGAGLSFAEGMEPALDKMLNVIASGAGPMEAMKKWGEDIGRVMAFAAQSIYTAAAGAEFLFSIGEGGKFTQAGRTDQAAGKELMDKANKMHDIAFGDAKPKTATPEHGAEGAGKESEAQRKLAEALAAEGQRADAEAAAKAEAAANKARQAKLKAMEAGLNEEKLQFNMSTKAEFDYWQDRIGVFAKGSEQYNAIVAKQATLAVEGAKKASEAIKKLREEQKKNPGEQQKVLEEGAKGMAGMQRDDARAEADRLDTAEELRAMQQKVDLQLREMEIREQSGRTLSEEAAAIDLARLHTEQYTAEIERLEDKKKRLQDDPRLSNGEADQQKKIDDLNRRIAELQGQRTIGAQQDAYAVKNANQSSTKGATDAIDEFTLAAMDSARHMRDVVSATLRGLNDQLLNGLTGQRADFRGVGAGMARGVASAALNKGEGMLLDSLGLGKGKAPTGTASDPLHTVVTNLPEETIASAAKGAADLMPGVSKALGGKDSGGIGGLFSTLLSVIPGFASGGAIPRDRLSIVGENGPEIFVPPVSGTIIPNHQVQKVMDDHIALWGRSGAAAQRQAALVASRASQTMRNLPRFAAGGAIASNMTSLVGERGPEGFLPDSVSTAQPDYDSGSGGSPTFHIDARGATDPAQTEVAIHRALKQWAPHIAAGAVQAVAERRMRQPSSRA